MKGAKVMAALAGTATATSTTLSTAELMAEFDWASLEPSATLNYTSCYGEFKCARLLVPLDWLNPDDNVGEEVAIAILTKPAEVGPDHPDYGGTIIVNPGGPNGSGTVFALRAGKVMQVTVDGKKKYDILGFDPRGVGESTPSTDCHRERFSRGVAAIEDHASGPLEVGSRSISMKMAYSRGRGRLCEEDEKTHRIRQFASTSSVSRDMVRIVDELDKQGLNTGPSQDDGDDSDELLELRSTKDATPRIQYWGFSYGTVLGRYFASMFPGRVGRMILEGVEDTHDFYNGVGFSFLSSRGRRQS
jgi:pimeloyl-ACP methyl ester carboxylesterase